MNALGIIFSDYYTDHPVQNELIRSRTPASLPYAGRYRTVDFALSSMVNVQMTDIGIIAKENYGSLIDHLGNGQDWDLNRRNGGLTMLTPLARPETHTIAARGRLDALRSIRGYIEDSRHDLIVMAFGGTVANIDLGAMAAYHLENEAYLTMACSEIPAGIGEMMLARQPGGRIEKISYLLKESAENHLCALGTYVMSRADLLEFLAEADNQDYTNMNRALIQKNLADHRIFGYEHPGYARVIRTVEDYFAASMDMLKPELQKELFLADRPVYTKVKDSVPTFYDYHAIVENSLIADGCTIKGTVRNSVIFRGVCVEEGAVVENAILMQNSVIERDARIACAITDKNARISAGVEVRGSARVPFVVGKGKRV